MPLLSGTTDIDNSDSTEANLRVLYPLDRFGVSDKFYQELSMLFSELPRSNAVKKKRAPNSMISWTSSDVVYNDRAAMF